MEEAQRAHQEKLIQLRFQITIRNASLFHDCSLRYRPYPAPLHIYKEREMQICEEHQLLRRILVFE